MFCNSKHGCDYKGYGSACKLPRLDLTGFVDEAVEKRDRPVLQLCMYSLLDLLLSKSFSLHWLSQARILCQ